MAETDLFYHVAVGMLPGLECVRGCPELKEFISTIQPEDLSMAFSSPYFWYWELWNWSHIWDEVPRECAQIFDGCPAESLPAIITPDNDHRDINGVCYIDYQTLYRW